MTRDDLIKNIKIKMDADVSADSEDYYSNYYNTLIDECLSVVANTSLPYQGLLEITWGGYYDKGDQIKSDVTYYTADSEQEDSNEDTVKRKDWLEVIIDKDGEPALKVQRRNNYGFLAKLPNDFLSFSDEASVEYTDANGDLSLNVDILYVNSKTIALSKDGNYKIYYNAEYPSIASFNTRDDQLENTIPTNVLKIIPSYVAGQLLMGEDPIKATQLKNEFETMLARLDINKPLISYNITNTSGWTE